MEVSIQPQKLQCPYCHDKISGTLVGCSCGAIFHEDCSKMVRTCTACFLPFVVDSPPSKESKQKSKSLIGSVSELNHKLMEDLISEIKNIPHFEEAYSIAKINSKGPLWLVGGKVYRYLINRFLNKEIDYTSCDFDFLTTELVWVPSVPKNLYWKVKSFESYGSVVYTDVNPFQISREHAVFRFRREDPKTSIDLVNLHKMKGLPAKKRNLLSYLSAVPLSVQSVAIDLEENLIFGELGIKSILQQTLWINNKACAEFAARNAQKSLFQYGKEKADQIGLKFDFTSGY